MPPSPPLLLPAHLHHRYSVVVALTALPLPLPLPAHMRTTTATTMVTTATPIHHLRCRTHPPCCCGAPHLPPPPLRAAAISRCASSSSSPSLPWRAARREHADVAAAAALLWQTHLLLLLLDHRRYSSASSCSTVSVVVDAIDSPSPTTPFPSHASTLLSSSPSTAAPPPSASSPSEPSLQLQQQHAPAPTPPHHSKHQDDPQQDQQQQYLADTASALDQILATPGIVQALNSLSKMRRRARLTPAEIEAAAVLFELPAPAINAFYNLKRKGMLPFQELSGPALPAPTPVAADAGSKDGVPFPDADTAAAAAASPHRALFSLDEDLLIRAFEPQERGSNPAAGTGDGPRTYVELTAAINARRRAALGGGAAAATAALQPLSSSSSSSAAARERHELSRPVTETEVHVRRADLDAGVVPGTVLRAWKMTEGELRSVREGIAVVRMARRRKLEAAWAARAAKAEAEEGVGVGVGEGEEAAKTMRVRYERKGYVEDDDDEEVRGTRAAAAAAAASPLALDALDLAAAASGAWRRAFPVSDEHLRAVGAVAGDPWLVRAPAPGSTVSGGGFGGGGSGGEDVRAWELVVLARSARLAVPRAFWDAALQPHRRPEIEGVPATVRGEDDTLRWTWADGRGSRPDGEGGREFWTAVLACCNATAAPAAAELGDAGAAAAVPAAHLPNPAVLLPGRRWFDCRTGWETRTWTRAEDLALRWLVGAALGLVPLRPVEAVRGTFAPAFLAAAVGTAGGDDGGGGEAAKQMRDTVWPRMRRRGIASLRELFDEVVRIGYVRGRTREAMQYRWGMLTRAGRW
ncbi:hypothetical protein DFJ73DRAFT_899341 [Zopfochytrium polystomum]|nr:hypothetical protein DFJ73DRAFT_899341 [Zopfochytrium polystomum]